MRFGSLARYAAITGILSAPFVASATPNEKDLEVLRRAPEVMRDLTEAPDNRIPNYLLERAECIAVFPSVTKGAFIVGGEHGRGVATCRTATGAMSSPAFLTVGGASVGWQFGGEQTDLVMLVMNSKGKDHFFTDSFKLGAEVSAAAGPVGRSAEAAGDPASGAGILSWSRSRGLFLGASLEGSVVSTDEKANERLYDRAVDPQAILVSNTLTAPAAASEFTEVAAMLIDSSSPRAANDRVSPETSDYASARNYGTTGTETNRPITQPSTVPMPRTASSLPRFAVAGILVLGLAFALRLRRAVTV